MTWIRRRTRPRKGQPTKAETADTRRKVIERSGGYCELKLSDKCIKGVLPETGPDPWSHSHAHLSQNTRSEANSDYS